MSTSILNDTKNSLGLHPEETAFDIPVRDHINTVFAILNQLGAGPSLGFMITGPTETWDQFFEETRLNTIKSYVYLRVRLLHDPPQAGPAISANERQIAEMDFRVLSEADY